MSEATSLSDYRRRLRFELARVDGSERLGVIRKALANPPAGAERKDFLDIVEACAREQGITSLKAPSKEATILPRQGFFGSLPAGDDAA